jgi:hypothetical protein
MRRQLQITRFQEHPMNTPRKNISPERKAAYYIGGAITAIGILLFFSNFVIAAANFGNFDNFEERGKMTVFRALGGMFLIVVGAVVGQIGKEGVAGSGVVLDPEQARKDLEPWSRMKGGMLQDTLEEVEVIQDLKDVIRPRAPVVKVRCQKCSSLNDESAKFCNQCGEPM